MSQPHRSVRSRWRWAVPAVAALAGGLFVTSALSARGTDLRSTESDLASLVRDRSQRVEALRGDARDVRTDIDALAAAVDSAELRQELRRARGYEDAAGFTPVSGDGLRVVLDDAPRSDDEDGIDPNRFVVHQQDLQGVVNAMWAAGAEGVTLQGVRLISTTAVKCVGNTVVLDDVPYAPPYVIEAVADPDAVREALAASPAVQAYLDDVEELGLGIEVDDAGSDGLTLPAYEDTPELLFASIDD